MVRLCFLIALFVFCALFPLNLIAVQWGLLNEDFKKDGDFGAFAAPAGLVEHLAVDATAEVKGGMAILKRIGEPAAIGPTMRAYFKDPKSNEFTLLTKIDTKKIDGASAHFIICMRMNGFEYFPTIEKDKIGDHETLEQNVNGVRKQEVKASPLGMHEYRIVGKSKDAYDLYFDDKLLIKNGVTRVLAGDVWEVAQVMVHMRAGKDCEIQVDFVQASLGIQLAVTPKDKLTLTWGAVKER